MAHLLIVRHGETDLNASNREGRKIFNGQFDTPLSRKGMGQASDRGRELAEDRCFRVTLAVSSTISRAVRTAQRLLAELSYAVELHPMPGFEERSLGLFENRPVNEVLRQYPLYQHDPSFNQFRFHFTQKAPGGENLTEVTERVRAARLRAEAMTDGDLLIVAHSGSIRCMVGEILGLSQQEVLALPVPSNAGLIVMERGKHHRLLTPYEEW